MPYVCTPCPLLLPSNSLGALDNLVSYSNGMDWLAVWTCAQRFVANDAEPFIYGL
jgi:hypothetical protein